MSESSNYRSTPIPPMPAAHASCEACPVHNAANLLKLGVDMTNWDFVVALAGNPNVGKGKEAFVRDRRQLAGHALYRIGVHRIEAARRLFAAGYEPG